jgi:D-glycero-D-manno-heptose 1,7-bisphosphate phosphatase
MNKAAFLDRDGVINRKAPEGQYVTRWEEVEFLPGVASAISMLNRAGFRVIVVSNQRCVAKGLVTTEEVEALHKKICRELADQGAVIDAVYFCPHEAGHGSGHESPPCSCRKPAPGMLLTAAKDHQIDLHASWMIGDSAADVAAGKSAGCRTVLIGRIDNSAAAAPDFVAQSLLDATQKILELDGLSLRAEPE